MLSKIRPFLNNFPFFSNIDFKNRKLQTALDCLKILAQSLIVFPVLSYNRISVFRDFPAPLSYICLLVSAVAWLFFLSKLSDKQKLEKEQDIEETNSSLPEPVQGPPFFIGLNPDEVKQSEVSQAGSSFMDISPREGPACVNEPGSEPIQELDSSGFIQVDAGGQIEGERSPTPPITPVKSTQIEGESDVNPTDKPSTFWKIITLKWLRG